MKIRTKMKKQKKKTKTKKGRRRYLKIKKQCKEGKITRIVRRGEGRCVNCTRCHGVKCGGGGGEGMA